MFVKSSKSLNLKLSYDGSLAATLWPEDLGTNPSGWTISGEVVKDYFEWVNYFEATHPYFGKVWGDYEDVIYADSKEAFEHFYANHPPNVWDYYDI